VKPAQLACVRTWCLVDAVRRRADPADVSSIEHTFLHYRIQAFAIPRIRAGDTGMPIYSFSYMNGSIPEPFTELEFPNDETARQEAMLTASDFDRRHRCGPVKAWLNGAVIVKQGEREIVRVAIKNQ
jgi:hypothetical protein